MRIGNRKYTEMCNNIEICLLVKKKLNRRQRKCLFSCKNVVNSLIWNYGFVFIHYSFAKDEFSYRLETQTD